MSFSESAAGEITVKANQTGYASLIHDALYQYLETVPISKGNAGEFYL